MWDTLARAPLRSLRFGLGKTKLGVDVNKRSEAYWAWLTLIGYSRAF